MVTLGQTGTAILTVDGVLSNYMPVFYVAFAVAFGLTPLMRSAAHRWGIVDHPDRVRKNHRGPTAYLGGLAIFLGWGAGLLISCCVSPHRLDAIDTPPGTPILSKIIVSALLILFLGLWDDVAALKPGMKIGGQVLAAAYLSSSGLGTGIVQRLTGPFILNACTSLGCPRLAGAAIAISGGLIVGAVIIGCCNASNLIDGLDGLCGGVTAIVATCFLAVAVYVALAGREGSAAHDGVRVILALALLGAVLGFLPFNFSPAWIFMGDAGSMFLGFACGAMMLLMAEEGAKWLLASMVIFALPMLDTSLAIVRRYVKKRPLFSADRHHFHHQLVSWGYSVKQAVVICYALGIFFGLLGLTMIFLRTRYAMALHMVTFASLVIAAFKIGMVHEQPATHSVKNLAQSENLDERRTSSRLHLAPPRELAAQTRVPVLSHAAESYK